MLRKRISKPDFVEGLKYIKFVCLFFIFLKLSLTVWQLILLIRIRVVVVWWALLRCIVTAMDSIPETHSFFGRTAYLWNEKCK